MPVGERFSAHVQTGSETHLASYTMGAGSFPGVKCGRGVALITHPPPIAEVKERVKLYLYSPPSGPSWHALGSSLCVRRVTKSVGLHKTYVNTIYLF
jgi:hypothetical protein